LALFFYNLLFPIALLLMLPRFVLRMIRRGKYRHKFGQRFGIYSARVRDHIRAHPRIWVHAVSVGEVLIAKKLIARLRQERPDLGVVLSTTTSTGFALAGEEKGEWLEVIYNPVDFPPCVNAAFNLIQPRLLILVEAEVWPNLVSTARARRIPVALVNARLSPRSERRYHLVRKWVENFFGKLDLACVQEPGDVDRWAALGIPRSAIRCTGSIKFDQTGVRAPLRRKCFRSSRLRVGRKALLFLWRAAPMRGRKR
jgi:3-deoxy-D-manno-octulosonic-acid transferase